MISRVAVLLISTTLLRTAVGGPDVDCGNIKIDGWEPYSELVRKYSNCTTATQILVYYTNLENLDFFSEIRTISTRLRVTVPTEEQLRDPQLYIADNDNLQWTNRTFASLSTIESTPEYTATPVYMIRNRKLCVPEENKEKFLQLTERTAHIQLCQCYVNSSFSGYYSKFSNNADNCDEITGNLIISDGPRGTPDPDFVKMIRNVRRIRGSLIIYNSCWRNLSFFSKLEKIRTRKDIPSIQILSNAYLENTFLPHLTSVKGYSEKWLKIAYNPKFRLHPEAVAQMTRISSEQHRAGIYYEHAVCNFTEEFLTAASLPSLRGCTVIKGNLTINEKSGFTGSGELWDLRSVEILNGCLTISNTQLKDLKFLANWLQVRCSADRVPILIEYNFLLQSVDVGFEVWSNYTSFIRLTNNGCLRSGVVAYLEQFWERPVEIYQDDAYFIPCWSKPRFTNEIFLLEVAVAVILLIFFYFLGGFLIRGALEKNQLDSTSHCTVGS